MTASGIEERIARYLQLEFGEDDTEALRASDLRFVGEAELDGIVTQFWSFPCKEPCWATVQYIDKRRIFGMVSELPLALGNLRDGRN